MHALVIALGCIQVLLAIALIVIIDGQETKNEGLGGTIGGAATSSSFKGKPAFDERLNEITKYLFIGFCAVSIIVATVASRL